MSTTVRNQRLLLTALAQAGEERRQTRRANRDASVRIGQLARQALDAGASVTDVAKAARVTRKTIYDLIDR